MEPSRTSISAPAISRRIRPSAGMTESDARTVASDAASRPESEPGAPPPDIPPRCALHTAPLFAAAPAPDALFWLLVVATGAAALYWLIRRQKTLRAAVAADPWSDARAVDNILTLAQDQRVVFRLVGRPANAGPDLEAVCAHLERRALLLLSARDAAAWAGRPVRAEFRVTVGDSPRFFRFDSVVLRCSAGESSPLLELARPARLEPYRRRAFPRIRPDRPQVAALGLWRLEFAPPAPGGTGLPPDPARLPAPLFVFRPGAAAGIRLDNLSASGLGVRISRDARPPARCLIFLCLRTTGGTPLALWLACERRHLTARPGRATALLGLRISHWGRVARADALIPWKPADDDGSTPPLLRWTAAATSLNL